MSPLYLHEGEQCFRELADALVAPVCVVRGDGKLLYGNHTWRFLTAVYEGADFPDCMLEMMHPEDRAGWFDAWQKANRSRVPYAIERRVRFTRGQMYVRQFEQGRPVRDSNGDVLEWVLVATPAQDSEPLIASLRRSLFRKDAVFAEVAHELRNPLAPITAAVRLLEAHRSPDQALIISTCSLISRQVTQLSRLVDDLLDHARLEHEQLDVTRNLIDLRQIVAAAAEVALPSVDARRQTLSISTTVSAAMVNGDCGRLTQVVVNLLMNATKFTGEGGEIFLTLEHDGRLACIKVRDTGVGISSEALPAIFDPYVRTDPDTTVAMKSGLGLGLALAQRLVYLHGGSLTAYSEGPGKGSEFVLRLPEASGM